MKRRWMVGFVLVAVAGIAGCKTLARQAFANPIVEVKDVKVKGVGLTGGSLDVILDVYNPNDYRIDARRVNYTVFVDSMQIATGEIERLLTLTNKGHSEIIVPVEFTLASVQRALQKFAQRGSLDYRVVGSFAMATPFGDITRPFSGTGTLTSFR